MNGPQDELEDFRRDPDGGCARLYAQCRPKFIGWGISNHGLAEADLDEVFQKALIIALQNIREERLTVLNGTLCTYLFGVGKKLILALLRKRGKTLLLGDEPVPTTYGGGTAAPAPDGALIAAASAEQLWKEVDALGEPCRSILLLTYKEGMTAEEIAEVLGYSGADTVRQIRKRCVSNLLLLKAKRHDTICYDILKMTKDKKTDEEIAQKLGFANAQEVQKRRAKCLDALR
jgi:RNA polymerase sigma-70 factor (ECF subfamily)